MHMHACSIHKKLQLLELFPKERTTPVSGHCAEAEVAVSSHVFTEQMERFSSPTTSHAPAPGHIERHLPVRTKAEAPQCFLSLAGRSSDGEAVKGTTLP